ncbi:MAG: cystathionine beta-lyase [Pseudomonadota bacterium]|nr:cystathionine beta-lyase [Pseudomonadota bacterium]
MKDATRIIELGRDPEQQHGLVNPPLYRGSTVLFPSLAALREASAAPLRAERYYGRHGTPTTAALEQAVAALEGAERGIAVCSGLAAIAIVLSALAAPGDEVLVVDCVYGPTRAFCEQELARRQIQVRYLPAAANAAAVRAALTPRTRLIFLESPGSLSFEMQDVPAIVELARSTGIVTVMDNTWATPLGFAAAAAGVDVVIHAATKYLVGHADAMLGVICTREALYERIKHTAVRFGQCPGAEEAQLGLRGLRTLAVRLERHARTAEVLMRWLAAQPEVVAIRSPAWPDDPGHARWQRDFRGASGLFAAQLVPLPEAALAALVDGLAHFGLGFSWGGYESLVLPAMLAGQRSLGEPPAGPLLRFHAGLEAEEDLLADLAAGFGRLRRARQTRA